ncbi:MAG: thiamine pyrophosphate-binding protein [Pseudomonadota bacterium]
MPEPVLVPHENVAVSMAHGYYMRTGRMQAVMVHVGPGTANSLNAIMNASRQRVPIFMTAGRTPINEQGRGRAQQFHPLGAGAIRPGVDDPRVRQMGLRAAQRQPARDRGRPGRSPWRAPSRAARFI